MEPCFGQPPPLISCDSLTRLSASVGRGAKTLDTPQLGLRRATGPELQRLGGDEKASHSPGHLELPMFEAVPDVPLHSSSIDLVSVNLTTSELRDQHLSVDGPFLR